MLQRVRSLAGWLAVIAPLLVGAGSAARAEETARPRLLVLPWLVVDRTTNKLCSTAEPAASPASKEAAALARSAGAALDAEMHGYRRVQMIPRKDWEQEWTPVNPGQLVRQGPGCAVCAPPGQLLRYDHAALQGLAQSVHADYVWLGVTVVPLTTETKDTRPDDCCREALAQDRAAVLARSSALLVRASDGEIVWERDARVLDRDVPTSFPRQSSNRFHGLQGINHSPARHRELGVDRSAHDLGNAFRREHKQGLPG